MTYSTTGLKKKRLRPQSAILTLYGDYVLDRSGEIGIGSLITLLTNFGLSEHAIRSAVSRMSRSGFLTVRRDGRKSYYSLTGEIRNQLTEGAQRIFHQKTGHWDGTWNVVTYSVPEHRRQARDRLRRELGWMGYGALGEAAWISPYDLTREVEALVQKIGIGEHVQIFDAQHKGHTDPKVIVSRCWDLATIHGKYADFLTRYRPLLEEHVTRLKASSVIEPSQCFVERFELIHEYRKLSFFDPDLPAALLPEDWLRPQAAALFHQYHDLLADKANKYFDSVYKEYQASVLAKPME
ncbi:MAG TPA: phenylacetic acid degradation operon negative regulatory protein PaaX [Dehalococcoidia bacterium]|nr:phenylacetic acid degradation operon negative regulatory protein PaaX [Dehalococcoidia bacterium]